MIINLTPHTVNLKDFEIPSSGVARVSQNLVVVGVFDGIDLAVAQYGDVVGLPDSQDNTMFIVSAMVRNACPDRFDLASPGDLIRDDNGNIIGAKNLIINDNFRIGEA
jgi:hypothetical protein